jgi:hypothetical protein
MPMLVLVFVMLGGLPASAVTHDAAFFLGHQAVLAASTPGGLVWSDAIEGSEPVLPVSAPAIVTRTVARVAPARVPRTQAAAPSRPIHRRALLRMPATDDDPPQSPS